MTQRANTFSGYRYIFVLKAKWTSSPVDLIISLAILKRYEQAKWKNITAAYLIFFIILYGSLWVNCIGNALKVCPFGI